MKELADFLAEAAKGGQRILVLCHHNADPDAVASAVVLSEVLKELGARAEAGASDDISLVSQNILKVLEREITVNPSLDADLVVLVDTSSLEHLGELGERLRERAPKLVVIDHHKPVEAMKELATLHFVREEFASEAELLIKLLEELGVKLKPEQASLLLAGIISDTGHFRLAKGETFGAVNQLLQAGADYERVNRGLKLPEDQSKRVAMLKAAGRSELRRVHGHLVVFSELGSFEGDAAGMLVRIGADAAFVGSEEKGKVRVSGRARPDLLKSTELHLGELMEEFGKGFGGSGGGHAGAASMNGKGKLEAVKKHLFKILQQKLKPKE
ncbi:MAG: DHH family phosphoesterase [Hadesarchaea archaeon]|nr:DHH family phosphoesterase [Hadesarchaea archaeon]